MDKTFISLADVPSTPRLDEYFGLWSIEEFRFSAMFSRISQSDLKVHVESASAPKKPTTYALKYYPAAWGGPPTIDAATGKAMAGQQDTPYVAVIPVSGTLMKQVSSLDDGSSTVQLRRDVRVAANDPLCRGIMLLVDSPGGSVSGTSDLAADVEAAAAKKPLYAFAEDLCASAAYWVASAAQKIYANSPTALVGSIGTYAGLYDMSGMAAREGIKVKLYKTGALKGAGFPGTEITEAQDKYFQGIVDETQKHFSAAVAKNRGMSSQQVAALATGAVFPAQQAQEQGLIDGIKTFEQAMAQLEAAAEKQDRQANTPRRLQAEDSTPTVNTSDAALAPVNSSTQEDAMSDPTKDAPTGPKAASLKELKAALPNSTAEFREQCMEEGLSLEASKDRYIQQQDAALAQSKAASKPVGVKAIGTGAKGAVTEDAGDAHAQLRQIAMAYQQGGMSRSAAFSRACRENEDLRQAWVDQHNAAHPRPVRK